jgi:hypothetical protein
MKSCLINEMDLLTNLWGRKLLNEELHSLYPSLDMIRMVNTRSTKWAGHAPCVGMTRKPERRRSLGKARHRWEYNIKKTDLEEYNAVVLIALIWLGIGTSGGLLRTWKLTSRFHRYLEMTCCFELLCKNIPKSVYWLLQEDNNVMGSDIYVVMMRIKYIKRYLCAN